MAHERALRSRGSETVTNWYCNACSWSVTVIDGKPEQLTIHQVRTEFANHLCSDIYGKRNAIQNAMRQSGGDK